MKTKKTTTPAPTKPLENVDLVELDNVVGGCACGCGMANCNMQMRRRIAWR